jgi:hypothetical protein
MRPIVEITKPKNFDRDRYIIPQIRELSDSDNDNSALASDSNEEEEPARRAFDGLKSIDRIPQPKNDALPRREVTENKERNVYNRSEEIRKANITKRDFEKFDFTKSTKDQSIDKIIKKIMQTPVEISTEDAANASPELRRQLMRRLRNRRMVRSNVKAYLREVLSTDLEPSECIEGLPEQAKIVDVEDLEMDSVFEVLKSPEKGLPEGSIVQKDISEQFRNELPPDERDNIIVVARVSDSLRCIFPEINNSKEEVEVVVDGGSQIVAIDTLVAVGVGLTWDPETVIHMQSANGQLNKTKGLARNVPFKFGEITVYLQLHVVDRAPYQVLLGRPFDVLTKATVENFDNGDQLITVTDPNSGLKCTIPTYPRGMGKRMMKRIPQPLKPESAENAKRERESNGEVNFQEASRTC